MEPPDSTRNQREVEQQDAKYEAIENLKKVLGESVKEHGDKQQDTNFFLAFGLLHMGNQVKTAIEWFGKAFSLAKEQDDKKQEIAASINLANAYKLDNQLQMAKRYDQNVLGIAREQKYRSQLNMAKKLEIEELSKIIESPELWKWEKSSLVHREMFIKLLQYAKLYPKYIKEINEVRFCCSKEFLIGMGRDGIRVYVGLRKDGHEMAVKRLPKDVCTDLAQQEKKVSEELTEARSNYVVNSLSLDSDSDKEFLFLIMDLCEETLENFVHRSSLDELVTTAPDIIRHILKGLADLHHGSMPILHRDVQPSNILRNVHGNWLLADFGISRILTADSNTHQSNQGGMEGCNWRAVESSYASSEDTGVRYKKESDIQVAGMVAFYLVTKGKHPFGGKPDQPRNLFDGKPVGLETLKDPVLKDLLSWMLSHVLEDRPSAEEALKHPYLQPKKQQFKMLCKVGKEPEIQMQDGKSDVVQRLNSDPADWKTLISADVLKYFYSDFPNGSPKTIHYGSSWTECLRFIENVSRQWHNQTRPKPQPDAFYSVNDPQEYFLNIFPTLVVRVHIIIRSSDWKKRADLKEYFTKDVVDKEGEGDFEDGENTLLGKTFLDSEHCFKHDVHEKIEDFTINKQGQIVFFPAAGAFFQFPAEAVENPVSIRLRCIRNQDCEVKPRNGDVFCSSIVKMEPKGYVFNKPVTVLLSHCAAQDGAYADYYDLTIQKLDNECEDLDTEQLGKSEDLPKKAVSDFCDILDYLPLAQAIITETSTVVATTRIRSEEIIVVPDEMYVYPRSYGNESDVEIIFPVGAVEEECRLTVQVFPARDMLSISTSPNDELIQFPVLKVSGQDKPFLEPVEVVLGYSCADVADLDEKFIPVGEKLPFTSKYGVLLHSHNNFEGNKTWENAETVVIERSRKDRLEISFCVKHFCKLRPIVKKSEEVSTEGEGDSDENHREEATPGVLAVCVAAHDIGSGSGRILSVVVAPLNKRKEVETNWGSQGKIFNDRFKDGEEIFYCVPFKDSHLDLQDINIRFYQDGINERYNRVRYEESVLAELDMRFLRKKCVDDKHYSTDCLGKCEIIPRQKKIDKVTRTGEVYVVALDERSVASPGTSGSPSTISPLQTSTFGHFASSNVPSNVDDQITKTLEIMKKRCGFFEKEIERLSKKRLKVDGEKNESMASRILNIGGPTATILISIGSGLAIVLLVPTAGVAAAFAGAGVAAATVAVKVRDKWKSYRNMKIVANIVKKVESDLEEMNWNEIVLAILTPPKEVGTELSRIFEEQLFMLKDDKDVTVIACCAVNLMFNKLKVDDEFNRKALLRKVLLEKVKTNPTLNTKRNNKKWKVHDVFQKPGLRKETPKSVSSSVEFQYLIKDNGTCDPQTYGYRGEIECDIDKDYNKTCEKDSRTRYLPFHCLVRFPRIWERFTSNGSNSSQASLEDFVSQKYYSNATVRPVRPVYRPHSPRTLHLLSKTVNTVDKETSLENGNITAYLPSSRITNQTEQVVGPGINDGQEQRNETATVSPMDTSSENNNPLPTEDTSQV